MQILQAYQSLHAWTKENYKEWLALQLLHKFCIEIGKKTIKMLLFFTAQVQIQLSKICQT